MSKHEITVGQPMFYRPRRGGEILETEVISVGRKYFEVRSFRRDKFFIESLQSASDIGGRIQLYLSKQAMEDEREHASLSREIRTLLGQYGVAPYSLETLRKIKELLDNDHSH